ncbi:XRE family transcriptional regulator [Nocardia wallacei]|uniref:XRE family transcriptional regulator n=1 Tax=Nocardia wallacei TaxID=480035 RepID=UPI002455ADCA|nr:XRE family transcriptional regulator [Nocardia wallacei]
MTTSDAQFVPPRLTFARRRQGMTRTQLARELSLTERTIRRWEAGEEEPGPDRKIQLAEALRVLPEYFGLDELDTVPTGAVSFRALTKLSARERDRAISAGEQGISIFRWIEKRFSLPENSVPTLVGWDPELAADTVRTRWQLGTGPIRNLLPVLELHGIRILSMAPDFRDVDAFSFYHCGTPYMFLDTSKTAERLRFDAAHELGHLCLHGEYGIPHGKEAEAEANRFASAFLMPQDSIYAARLRGATVDQIIRAKSRWKVAAMALTHRLHALELLTDWTYRSACVELSKRGFRTSEPGSTLVHERSQVIGKVVGALRTEGMSIRKIAYEFGLPVEALTVYMFGLTMTPHKGAGQPAASSTRPNLVVLPSHQEGLSERTSKVVTTVWRGP